MNPAARSWVERQRSVAPWSETWAECGGKDASPGVGQADWEAVRGMGRPTCEVRPATHRNHRLAITDLRRWLMCMVGLAPCTSMLQHGGYASTLISAPAGNGRELCKPWEETTRILGILSILLQIQRFCTSQSTYKTCQLKTKLPRMGTSKIDFLLELTNTTTPPLAVRFDLLERNRRSCHTHAVAG